MTWSNRNSHLPISVFYCWASLSFYSHRLFHHHSLQTNLSLTMKTPNHNTTRTPTTAITTRGPRNPTSLSSGPFLPGGVRFPAKRWPLFPHSPPPSSSSSSSSVLSPPPHQCRSRRPFFSSRNHSQMQSHLLHGTPTHPPAAERRARGSAWSASKEPSWVSAWPA